MVGFNRDSKSRGASSRQSKPSASRPFNWRKTAQFFSVLLVVLVMAGLYQVVEAVLSQPVSRVVVNGNFLHVNKQDIATEVEPFLVAGFVLLDLDGVRQQLLQRPWVFDVAVSRRWPDEIVIKVEEQKAIARWGSDAYLNFRGELFRPLSKVAAHDNLNKLPFLDGPDDSAEKVMYHFSELNEVLNEYHMQLVSLVLNDRDNWVLRLQNDIDIVLGGGDVMEKMRRLLFAYEQGLSADFEQIRRIDMRYSNGFAVAWRNQSSKRG